MENLSFRTFVEARSSTAPSLSPDGRSLAYVSDLTGYPEAYLHLGVGRDPRQLTEFRERVGRIRWTPDGRRMVLDTDLGGDERWAVRTVRPDGGGHRTLTHDPKVMHLMGGVSPDGSRLSCSTNARDPALFDCGVIDLDSAAFETLLADDASNLPGCFSPDGSHVVATRVHGSFREELRLVPVAGGPARDLTPAGIEVRHLSPTFEPTGRSLLLLTDRGRDFLALARLDLGSGGLAFLHAPDDRDVEALALSEDGATALLVENVRGYSRLLAYRLATGAAEPISHPAGVITDVSLSWDGARGAFALAHPGSPPEVYTADLRVGASERATRSPREGIQEEDLVHPEEVRFRSFDGTEIPGWLYLPRVRSSDPRPTVIKVHGGPESQARPRYDPVVQYLLHRGFAVYEPNVRGSTGYGRRYAALDDKRLRFDAVKDLAEAAEFLKRGGAVDGDRISLLGGSYGGFMVLAGLAFFPDLWKAGVDIVGIANFKTFLRRTGPYRRKWREAEYGSIEEEGEFLDEISPVRHADRIRAPLLVIQGANDPRVPADEAEQIVAAVRGRGGRADYRVYDDEGHGIVKLKNRIDAYEAVVSFLLEEGT